MLNKIKLIIIYSGIFLCFFFILPQKTTASSSSIVTKIGIEGDKLEVLCQNESTLPIYKIFYRVYFPDGNVLESKVTDELEPKEINSQKFTVNKDILTQSENLIYVKGEYITTDNPYHNKFPAPFLATILIPNEDLDSLNIEVERTYLYIDQDNGKLSLSMTNLSSTDLSLELSLILPEGIKCTNIDKYEDLYLKADGKSQIHLDLVNSWRNAGDSSTIIINLKDTKSNQSKIERYPFSISKKEDTPFNVAFIFGFLVFAYLAARYYFKLPLRYQNLIFILGVTVFIFEFIPLKYILSNTSTTGGDTFSHYNSAKYITEHLHSKGKLTGWYPGSYAGFPILTFYTPLAFILISIFSFIINFNIAFKIISVLGIVGIPFSVYILTKKLKFQKNGQLIAATLSLLFILNEAYSMYGGNLTSTLAGEFAHALGNVFLLIFTGYLYSGIKNKKYSKVNSILLCLTGLSHPYPFIIAVLQQIFFLLPKFYSIKEIKENFKYIVKVNLLAFLLIAFWAIPFVVYIQYTTEALTEFWEVRLNEVIPDLMLPFFIVSIPAFLFALIAKKRSVLFISFSAYLSVILLLLSNNLKLVNIRFLPFIALYVLIIAGYGIGKFINIFRNYKPIPTVLMLVCVYAIFMITKQNVILAPTWVKWNYTGYENKPYTEKFEEITEYIRSLPGNDRVGYEHSTTQENFGTIRTYESLYEYTGKATLEGLYLHTISTTPFIYYIQSEASEISTNIFTYLSYTHYDAEEAASHLKMFNTRYFIASSDPIKEQMKKSKEYKLLKEFHPYAVFELTRNPNSYIEVLSEIPLQSDSKDWNQKAYNWYITNDPNTYIKTDKDIPFPQTQGCSNEVRLLEFNEENIAFGTDNINCPHLIRISYFPRWKVKGAKEIYRASPNFMIIFPEQNKVELSYGKTYIEYIATALSILGLIILLPSTYRKKITRYLKSSLKSFKKKK